MKIQRIDLAALTDRLTPNQCSTIESLDGENFVILGCAEPVAIRLCKDGVRRPALVERRKGEEFWNFRLTALGVMVKERLAEMTEAE